MKALSRINALTLSIAGKEAAKSDRPDPGDYRGGFTVTFDDGQVLRGGGPVRQGEEFDQAVWQNVPWQMISAVLFGKTNGVTMEAVMREALELVEAGEFPGYVASPDDVDAETGRPKVMRIKDAASAAVKTLTEQTTKTFRGKATNGLIYSVKEDEG
jgi:hypothetical protein